eukprot:2044387-Pleurochrysis_carterae.AAC.1
MKSFERKVSGLRVERIALVLSKTVAKRWRGGGCKWDKHDDLVLIWMHVQRVDLPSCCVASSINFSGSNLSVFDNMVLKAFVARMLQNMSACAVRSAV